MGASFERSATFIHHIEEIKRVSYRYYKNFSGIIIDKKNSKKPFQIRYFVRKKKLNKKIKEKKLSSFYHSFEYGRHNVFHVKSNILQNKCLNELNDNEFFLVH